MLLAQASGIELDLRQRDRLQSNVRLVFGRLAVKLLTGSPGKLVAFVLDVSIALGRYALARVTGRRIEP